MPSKIPPSLFSGAVVSQCGISYFKTSLLIWNQFENQCSYPFVLSSTTRRFSLQLWLTAGLCTPQIFFCEVICTGNKLFCERAQKWHFFFHTSTHTFFVRKKRRKSSEVIIEPAPYFWGSLLSLVPIYLPSTDFPGRGQAPLTSGI